jgi:hypothetical protein
LKKALICYILYSIAGSSKGRTSLSESENFGSIPSPAARKCYNLNMNISELWTAFNPYTALLVFVAYILVDGMYAYYTLAVAEKKPLKASTVGALMHFLIAIGVLSYVQNYLYIIPLAFGSWIGTYLVVYRSK